MKQQSRKAKGRRLQNHVRDRILKNFPHLKARDVQCVENYAPGPDIILSKVAAKLVPWQWEVKNQENVFDPTFIPGAPILDFTMEKFNSSLGKSDVGVTVTLGSIPSIIADITLEDQKELVFSVELN